MYFARSKLYRGKSKIYRSNLKIKNNLKRGCVMLRTTRRKIVSLLLSLAMILTALPLAGVTAFAAVSGDFEYTILEDGTAEITFYYGDDETVNIPAEIDGYTVTYISDDAFDESTAGDAYHDRSVIKKVIIPETVEYIGAGYVFDPLYCLENIEVNIANENYSSQDGVLFNKNKTELLRCPVGKTGAYQIPNSVTSIGEGAFEDCDGLTSVTIGNGVTSIGEFAFWDCDGLTSVTIPNSVTSIGVFAFLDCDGLTSVTIGNGVTSIGDHAFRHCYSLTEINVDVSNKNYSSQDGVLFNKNKTELLRCPEGKTGAYQIPNSVTSIGDWAFAWCDSLTSVTIGNGVTSIGEDAFWGCNGLTEIKVDASNKNYSSQDGVLFDKNKTVIIQYPIGNTRASYNIPNSVTSIGDYAFAYCDSLTSVTIPDSVTSIGEYAFFACSLESVTIPDSVTSIGDYAFGYCIGLTSVTIPVSVISIGDKAFYECHDLTDIYILNKNCNIVSSEYFNTIPTETTIHGCAGSTAEEYAKENGNKFVDDVQETHNMVPVPAKAATCTEDGNVEYYHCSECNKNFKDINGNEEVTDVVVKATGHTLGEKVAAKAATCTADGNIEYYHCSACNKNFKDINGNEEVTDVVVKATGHTLGEKVAAKAATCTEDGNIEYYHCSACNKNFKDKDGNEEVTDVVVKATGHNMAQVAAKAATCTEDGNIEYYHCSACNKNFKDKDGKEEVTDVVVKATGHNYENGVCTVCGEKDPNASKPSGEVSGDGKLSTVDAKWILQNIAKSRDFSDEQSKAADLNGDGKLSVVDVKWVLQIVAGMRNAETLELITK